MSTQWRKWLKRVHPEGIPWPGSLVYSVLSRSWVFRQHYALVAHDIVQYGSMHHILDIGTGPGRLLLSLNQVSPHSELVGVDISPAMVAQACKTIGHAGLEKEIHLGVSSANALAFADNTFDCVVSTGSFHHWKDPTGALAQIHRVLKGNGTALMYDLVRKMPADVKGRVRSRFGSLWHILLWLHSFEEPFLSPGEMAAIGRQSDFVVVETRFVGALCCLVLQKRYSVL